MGLVSSLDRKNEIPGVSANGTSSTSTSGSKSNNNSNDISAVLGEKPTYTSRGEYTGERPTYTRGEYTPLYQDKANDALNEYLNYGPFEYDINEDKLYQQYVDLYTQQGKIASEDAIGQAAALTGGYGNSYAATAGSQAYLQYMQELSAMAPEFEDRAYEKYLRGRSDAKDRYTLLQDAEDSNYAKYLDEEDRNYSRYRDDVADYESDRDNHYYLEERDYGRYRDDVADYENSVNAYLKNKEIEAEKDANKIPAEASEYTNALIGEIDGVLNQRKLMEEKGISLPPISEKAVISKVLDQEYAEGRITEPELVALLQYYKIY